MKKLICFLLVCVTLVLAGCQNGYYYKDTSTLEVTSTEVSDPVPPYVFGEKGFYDTVADAEFYPAEGIYAKEIGEEAFAYEEHTFYVIVGVHPTYMLCDADGQVYKNTDMPWIAEPDSEEFATAHPALTKEKPDAAD